MKIINLLFYDFSYTKFLIFGFAVFIFFELIIGWYMPKKGLKK